MNIRLIFDCIALIIVGLLLSVPIVNGIILGSGDALGFGIPIFGGLGAIAWFALDGIGALVARIGRKDSVPDTGPNVPIVIATLSFGIGAAMGGMLIFFYT